MTARTKRAIQKEVSSLKAVNPPDTDEFRKDIIKGGMDPEGAGLPTEPDKGEGVEEPPETPPEPKSEVPDPEENFRITLMDHGYKEGQARVIAEHIARRYKDGFTDPAKMYEVLNRFPYAASATMRKNVMDFWIDMNGLTPSPEYEAMAGLTTEQLKEKEEKVKEGDRSYAFDPSSGDIRQAMGDERGITIASAEMLRAKWLVAHPNAQGSNKGDVDDYVQGPDGNMVPNPNKKYSLLEHRAIEAADRPGELTQLIQSQQLIKQAQEAGVLAGGEKKGGIFGMTLEEFTAFKSLMTPPVDVEMREILKKLAEGSTKTDDPMVVALKAQIDEQKRANETLAKRLDDEREERHKNELAKEVEERKKLETRVTELANKPASGSKTPEDIISNAADKVMGEITGLRTDIIGFAKLYPPPFIKRGPSADLPAEHKAIILGEIRKEPGVERLDPAEVKKMKDIVAKYKT